jgi:hypothetical protein
MSASLALVYTFAIFAVSEGEAPPEQPKKDIHPDAASEGARELDKQKGALKSFIEAQPYGKTWKELVKTEKPPKDPTGLGEADTHKDLKHDPMEVQQAAQYLEDTATEVRFGRALIRGVRVFRYGKLRATQLVVEMIGREDRDQFKKDVELLATAWKEPLAALAIGNNFKLKKNDLIEQKKRKPAEFPAPPLRIEFEPSGLGTGAER